MATNPNAEAATGMQRSRQPSSVATSVDRIRGYPTTTPSLACVRRVALRQDEALEADRQQRLRAQPLHRK